MKDVIKELVGWIVSILLIVAVSYLIVTFVGQRTQVSGSSMETTLSDGDHLIVDKDFVPVPGAAALRDRCISVPI